jgi:hypothetical protein
MNKILVMKRGSTLFLRATLLVMALVVLALCIFALPSVWKGGPAEFPAAANAVFAIVIVLYASTIPYFIALWQTLKLLGYIDRNTAFSEASVRALGNIKRCAIAITVLFMINVPLLLPIAEADDAPGLLLFGFAFACAPIVIAVFAAVLQRLLKSAIEMKSENELTV